MPFAFLIVSNPAAAGKGITFPGGRQDERETVCRPERRVDFFAFDPTSSRGVRVPASDMSRSGRADLIVAAGQGRLGPNVRVLSGLDLTELRKFDAFGAAFLQIY